MKKALFIHQSSELYGSDKTLLTLIKALNSGHLITPIVVLPNEGRLASLLRELRIKVIITPVIKLSRGIFKVENILKIPIELFKSIRAINKELKGESIKLVYSNTLAVLLGGVYAKIKGVPHVWHVHEIIQHPRVVAYAYPILVNVLSRKVIFNSFAAQKSLCKGHKRLQLKSSVVWNGINRDQPFTEEKKIDFLKRKHQINPSAIVIGLVGRISRWKGHELLLKTFKEISKSNSNTELVFIGSPPLNQEIFEENLKTKIKLWGLSEKCKIISFQEKIWEIYDMLDVVVVPSTEPEPFGLVALEGMLSKKPVIASNHGGIVEIINNNKSGLLFKANDEKDLKRCLMRILENDKLRSQMGIVGKERADKVFSVKAHVSKISSLLELI
jgi:glycosyltransferase involved in cell wall biosynthesis